MIHYMLVIGDKEVEANAVSVRSRNEGNIGAMPADELVEKLRVEIETKSKGVGR